MKHKKSDMLNEQKVKSTKKKTISAKMNEAKRLIRDDADWVETTQFGKKKPKTKNI